MNNLTGRLTIAFGALIAAASFTACEGAQDSTTDQPVATMEAAVAVSFEPAPGAYPVDQQVTLTSATPNVVIFYTTDGSEPNAASGTRYDAPVSVAGDGTRTQVRAIAYATGYDPSGVATAHYAIDHMATEAPTMSPAGGTFDSAQLVELSTKTAGASIVYTMDGSEPTESSTVYQRPILIDGHGTTIVVKAAAFKAGMLTSAPASETFTVAFDSLEKPTLSPPPGTYPNGRKITLETTVSNSRIYYTTDGTDPTEDSNEYVGPIDVRGHGANVEIRAFQTKPGFLNSKFSIGVYKVDYPTADAPKASPVGGVYSADQLVVLRSTTLGARVHYTLDGSDPTPSSPTYSEPIRIAGHSTKTTLRAMAAGEGMKSSHSVGAIYHLIYPPAAAPTAYPVAGVYPNDQTVTLTSGTAGAVVHFTLDGTEPTEGSPIYTAPVSVKNHGTTAYIRAVAVTDGFRLSDITNAGYGIQYGTVQVPRMSPSPGAFTVDQMVSLSSDTPASTIYYTTDGTVPNEKSLVYGGSIAAAGHGTIVSIRAIAHKHNMLPSAVTAGSFAVVYDASDAPSISPTAGVYASDQMVILTSDMANASIYYTTDGSAPTADSTPYTQPIDVAGHKNTMQVRAIAMAPGHAVSSVTAADYQIVYPETAAPAMSPEPGSYAASVEVELSASSATAQIHYTTDGSAPSVDSPTYSSAIVVSGDGTEMTIRAIAIEPDSDISVETSGTYSIEWATLAAPTITPDSGTFDQDSPPTIAMDTTEEANIYYTLDGSTPDESSAEYKAPFELAASADIRAIAMREGAQRTEVASADIRVNQWLHVATDGDDSADGSADAPFASPSAAVLAATSAGGHFEIRMAAGTYQTSEHIELSPRVSILGGYDAADWSRDISANETLIEDVGPSWPHMVVRIAAGAESDLRVQGLTLLAFATSEPAFGIWADGGSATIDRNVIVVPGFQGGANVGVMFESAGSPMITRNRIMAYGGDTAVGVFLGGSTKAVVFSNVIDTSFETESYNLAVTYEGGSPVVANNTIRFGPAGVVSAGIGPWSIESGTATPFIENNIVWSSAPEEAGVCVAAPTSDQRPQTLLSNNLFDCGWAMYVEGDAKYAVVEDFDDMEEAAGNISLDMVDGSNNYFVDETHDWNLNGARLASGHPLVDGGIDASSAPWASAETAHDLNDFERFEGPWSMGAYQLQPVLVQPAH